MGAPAPPWRVPVRRGRARSWTRPCHGLVTVLSRLRSRARHPSSTGPPRRPTPRPPRIRCGRCSAGWSTRAGSTRRPASRLSLGSRPRTFSSRDERVAQALAAEPDATEERRAEIRQKASREAQGGGLLRPDVLPGQERERVLGGAAGGRARRRGRERRRGAPGRGRGGDGLRRAAGRLRAVGLSRQDRVGAVGRGLRAGPRAGAGSAGTTRPAARSNRSCTAT